MDRPIADLSAPLRPVAEARAVPNAPFTDPQIHAEECAALLVLTWAGHAVAAQVPKPGDAVTVTFPGAPRAR